MLNDVPKTNTELEPRVIKLRTKRDFERFHTHRARERREANGNGRFTPKASK